MALSLSTTRRKNGLWRLQSAMEYLMTYGWAILIIAVVLAALFELGVFNGSNLAPQACIAQAGFVCKNPVYTANGIGITFGQTAGRDYYGDWIFVASQGEALNQNGIPINFTCTATGCANAVPVGVLVPGQIAGADFNASKFAYGQIPANAPIGTPFAGYVWLGYCFSPCSAPTAYSKVATITAKEAGTSSASFGGYFGGGSGSSSPPPAPPPSQQTYSVTLADNPSGYGTASSPNSLTGISPGNTISITASPKNGYIFTGWSSSTGNIVIADPSVESTTANVEGSGTVTAGFAIPYVPISLSTSGTTPAPFQQNLSVGGYSTFTYNGVTYNGINQQWSNVEFTTGPAGTGTALQAWCESGCSGSSTAIVWVRLPNGFSGSTTIYMNFMPNDVMSASGPTGEAPQLSSTYAEYDNGASVFNNYWNFAGRSEPTGITSSSDTTYNNGAFTSGPYGGFSTENIAIEPFIAEFYGSINNVQVSEQDFSLSNQNNGYGSQISMYRTDGFCQNMEYTYTGYYTNGGCFSLPSGDAIFGQTQTSGHSNASVDYSEVSSVGVGSSSIGTPLHIGIGQGFDVYWLRTRAYPPNGVMPSYSFGSSVQ